MKKDGVKANFIYNLIYNIVNIIVPVSYTHLTLPTICSV